MKIKFTPGPWRVGMSSVLVKNEKTGAWCKFAGHHKNALLSKEEAKANLVLASAAPDLLEACMAAVECGMVPVMSAAEGGAAKYSRHVEVADMIRAAIAKATGDE